MAVERLSRAERREQTRDGLIAAADRLFVEGGFHATTLDQIAAAAGYTKGAVYSNFASKEDLFFAVYEQRAERMVAAVERMLAEHGPAAGLERMATDTSARRGRDDGWLAVFFEFWAHAIRHPEYRARFADIHGRLQRPVASALTRFADERGIDLPVDALPLAIAANAMQIGLALERLTQPEVVDESLGGLMSRLLLDDLQRRTR